MNNEPGGSAPMESNRKNILICDTQPVAVEGLKWLVEKTEDLSFAGSVGRLETLFAALNPVVAEAQMEAEGESAVSNMGDLPVEATASLEVPADAEHQAFSSDLSAIGEALGTAVRTEAVVPSFGKVDVVVVDKSLGFPAVMDFLQQMALISHPTPVVVWGSAITEGEALRLLQAGAKGIVRRTSGSQTLLDCLRTVTAGGTWMEDGIFGSAEKLFNPRRSQLTSREREVVVLVEKGLRNRDIAKILGIQTGTVKIHLKHIFEKTGVRGRYGLAFTGLQSKGSIAMTAPPQYTA